MSQKTYLWFLFTICSFSLQANSFVENKGQLIDFERNEQSDIFFYKKGNVDIYFRESGITYVYKKKNSIEVEGLTDREKWDLIKQDSTYYYRLDMNFHNASGQVKVTGEHKTGAYTNYYLPNSPEGKLFVPEFQKIKYSNVYENIDLEFYFKGDRLKYDIILRPNARLSDVKLYFPNIENIRLEDNEIKMDLPIIGLVKESLPRSFQISSNGKEEDIEVQYALNNNVISFNAEYNTNEVLVVDPEISWQTYYDGVFGIGRSNRVAVRGDQFIMTSYTFSADIPVLDPGSGAYFQDTIAGSGDIVIVKFDTTGVRIWSTYYGGTEYENFPDVEIDGQGRIVVCFQTESTDIPLDNAGGYFDNTYTPGTFSWESAFVTRFNTNGVRDWATHYDHFQVPFVVIDHNDNIILVGQSQYDNPPVQFLSGAYNQSTVSLNGTGSSSSGDYFIAKFNSSTSRVWATNLGGTCREQIADIAVDNLNNFYILGAGDNYYGTSFVTANAGGYYDNQLGQGTGGTAIDRGDILLHKFSSSGQLLWGTAFGGSGFEWAWPSSSSITTDQDNNVYICAPSPSTDLPFTDLGNGAYFDNVLGNPLGASDPSNHFIARFNPSTNIEWCTYWGDLSYTYSINHGVELEFNHQNRLIVSVGTNGNAGYYPLVNRVGDYNAAANTTGGGDIHLAEFDENFSVDWATYYGGVSGERLGDMALADDHYAIFMTSSWNNYPSTPNPVDWVLPSNANVYFDSTFSQLSGTSQLITKFSKIQFDCDTVEILTNSVQLCEGDSLMLEAIPSGGTWSINSGGGVIIDSTFYTPSITNQTSVFINYSIPSVYGCTDTSDQIEVIVTPLPDLPTVLHDTVCKGDSATLFAIAPNGVVFHWFSQQIGSVPFFEGDTFGIAGVISNQVYYVEAEDGLGCISPSRTEATVSLAQRPSVPTVEGDTVCEGDQASLLATDPTGVIFEWYENATGGAPIYTGANLIIDPALVSDTFYVASFGDHDCYSLIRAEVDLLVNPLPNAPIVIHDTVCEGDSATLLAFADSANVYWYTSSVGGIAFLNDSIYVIDPATSDTIYYVETSDSNNCVSGRVDINLTVLSTPESVQVLNDTVCFGDSATLYAILPNGVDFNWFTEATEGVSFYQGDAFGISSAIMDTSFFVEAENTVGCRSMGRTEVFLEVIALPLEPQVLNDTVCEGAIATLEAIAPLGVDFEWYENATGGASIFTGSSFLINPATSSETYYVEAIGTQGCSSSSRTEVVLHVYPNPLAPDTENDTVCEGEIATLLASNDGAIDLSWFDQSQGGSIVNSGNTFVIDPALTNQTYYVEAIDQNNCISERTEVNLVVYSAPDSALALNDTVCFGGNALLEAVYPNNVSFNWYETASSGAVLSSGVSFPASPVFVMDTFYVEAVSNQGCGSSGRSPVYIEVVSLPNLEELSNEGVSCNQEADATVTVAANDGTSPYSYSWDPNTGNQTGSTANNLAAGTYEVYVVDHFGCLDTITVNVTEPEPLQIEFLVTNANCNVGGTAQAVVSGGTAPYAYQWNDENAQTTSQAINLIQGLYTLTITDDKGCSTAENVVVSDTSLVNAAFTADTLSGFNPLEVKFENLSSGPITNYLWEFMPDSTSTEQDPSFIYTVPGEFTVYLTVSNTYCSDTDSVVVTVDATSFLFVPNVFTPNNDELNDRLVVVAIGMRELEVEIFNRWGQRIFDWTGFEVGGWDGRTYSGNVAPSGTYYYLIRAIGNDGEEYLQTSYFELIK